MGLAVIFDCVIGNPPYQRIDIWKTGSASPLYHKFVKQAQDLNPRYCSLVIPARWFTGGRGLDAFRKCMLNDARIRLIWDYLHSKECFADVDVAGGICWFVWNRDAPGTCTHVLNIGERQEISERVLNRFPLFLRYEAAESIVRKVAERHTPEQMMDTMISTIAPFGLNTNARPMENGDLLLKTTQGTGSYPSEKIKKGRDLISKYKVLGLRATSEHAGKAGRNGQHRVLCSLQILPPGAICTGTWLVLGAYDTEVEAENLLSYLQTRFVRFLIKQATVSQHIARQAFQFVPIPDCMVPWSDEALYVKYSLTQKEIDFVASLIRAW